jgi:antitoxin component of MazEF toxin-antitoxin module
MKIVKVTKWGNSLGIRLPTEFINLLNIEENTILNMAIDGKVLKIQMSKEINGTKPYKTKPYKTIEELFDGAKNNYEPVNITYKKSSENVKIKEVTSYKTIEELFEGFTGEYEPFNINYGEKVGNEVW